MQGSYLLGGTTHTWTNLERVLTEMITKLINDYKQRLISDGKSATGNLINSIQLPELTFTSEGYELSLSMADYWKYVEYGRKPGKFPPPNVIESWIQVKPGLPRPTSLSEQKSLAFLIGRKIAREGIEPGNQYEETLDAVLEEYAYQLSDAISLDIQENLENSYNSLAT